MTPEQIFELICIIFGVVVGLTSVITAIKRKVAKGASEEAVQQSYAQNKNSNAQRYRRPNQAPKGTQQGKQSGVHGNDGHVHQGSTETYDPIVGSLGQHSDEGCDELDGVRLIVTDLTYETDDDNVAYDRSVLGKSIVLGEILNTPRFKVPYGKK